MLFASFSSAYIVRQSGTDWQVLTLPSVLWLNTLLLVISSISIEVARIDARKDKWRAAGASVFRFIRRNCWLAACAARCRSR